MSYERVLEAMVEHDLEWDQIDQIHLSPETYEEFQNRDNRPTSSSWETSNVPAIRETLKEEKIVYVAPNGIEVTVPL